MPNSNQPRAAQKRTRRNTRRNAAPAAPVTEATEAPATEAASTEAAPADKPKRYNHADHIATERYTGASPLRRSRTKPARVMLNRVCETLTDRTRLSMLDLRDAYAGNPFPGANADAGILAQLIALGYCVHVADTGAIVSDGAKRYATGADARFQLTDKAIAY